MVGQVTSPFKRFGMPVLCGLLVLLFIGAGVVKLIPIEFEQRNFAHFGYAPWFMILIAFVEIGGALMLAVRQTRLAGSLLLAATMVGAAASHLKAGDGLGMATPALVLLALLIVVALANLGTVPGELRARFTSESA